MERMKQQAEAMQNERHQREAAETAVEEAAQKKAARRAEEEKTEIQDADAQRNIMGEKKKLDKEFEDSFRKMW
jgi:hypothetical protein